MYVEKPQDAKKFVAALRRKNRSFVGVDIVLAPAFPFLRTLVEALKGSPIKIAAQTVSAQAQGAHTGDVSAPMLKASGVSSVIIGHSERRAAGETDETINAQVLRALESGLTAIVCIGETERDPAGAHFAIIAAQLAAALRNFPKQSAGKLVIAYEPVWAIGKSAADAMQPAELREMGIFIRKTLADILERAPALRVPILYGGSVDSSNCAQLLSEGDVSGFLVGRASAELTSFIELLTACKK